MPDKEKNMALALAGKAGGKPARNARHGLYSWVDSKRLPRGRAFVKVRRELATLREDLIVQHGGKDITPAELILVDSAIEGLGVQKLLALYVRQYGIVDSRSAKRGSLELSPILGRNWVSYANQVRQALMALEELRKNRVKDAGQTPPYLEYVRQKYGQGAQDDCPTYGPAAPPGAQESRPEAAGGEISPEAGQGDEAEGSAS